MTQGEELRQLLMSVTGPIEPLEAGITDAHSHAWIAQVVGAAADSPILDDFDLISMELSRYVRAGGRTLVDCQPGGCGRDARVLRRLAQLTNLNIVACTGFHLRKYYPPEYWLFDLSADKARLYFAQELEEGVEEASGLGEPVRAGAIKIACESTLDRSPVALMEAAAMVSHETDAAIEIHTEKGAQAEEIVRAMARFGAEPRRLVLCHVDKCPDFALHRELADMGVLLEYDTFNRPKYKPEVKAWPLLERMLGAGLDSAVAVATDAADSAMWRIAARRAGPTSLITQIVPRLQEIGCEAHTVARLVGGNIAERLRRPV